MARLQRAAALAALLQFSLMPGPTFAQEDCAADTHTVSGQAELNTLLQDCGEAGTAIEGNIRVASSASGSLQISAVGVIAGSIIIEDNGGLESLQLESAEAQVSLADGSAPGLILRNLGSLSEVTGQAEGTFATVEIRDVPSLERVNLPNLSPALELRVINATKLDAFRFGPQYTIAGTIELRDVGLSNLDDFFRGGMPGQNISVGGELGAESIHYGLVDAMNVSIAAAGHIAVLLERASDIFDEGETPRETHVEYLELSSDVRSFGPHRSNAIVPTVGTFVVRDSTIFDTFATFKDLQNLVIHDNPLFSGVSHDEAYANYSWRSISIVNNPNFFPKVVEDRADPNHIDGWVWPSRAVETIELAGNFRDDIFAEWIQRGEESDEPLVTKKFTLKSTMSFDCGPLNELHDKGVLQGEYSCSKGVRSVRLTSTSVLVAVAGFVLASML